MSGTNVSSTSIFVSTPQAGRMNDANWNQLNGIDPKLAQQWNDVSAAAFNDPSNKGNEGLAINKARLDFVNSLTPDQLKTNAGFQMGAGWDKSGNYTWQAVKDYSNATSALEDKVRSLMMPGVDQSKDPTLNSIYDLIGGLLKNTPGALEQATKYLATSASADKITLSTGAMTALATGNAATAASLLKKGQSSDPSTSDSGASTALAVLKATESKNEDTKTSTSGKVSDAVSDPSKISVNRIV